MMPNLSVPLHWIINCQTASLSCCSNARVLCTASTARQLTRRQRKFFSASSRQLKEPLSFKRYSMPQGTGTAGAGADAPVGLGGGGREGEGGVQKKRTAYVALGSNLGDRIGWIEKACNEMDARGITIKRTSSLWETEPMYVLDQDKFVNGACEVETTLEPLALLDQLQDIENTLGRKKLIDKGPRNIDLDILLYEDRKVDHERLKIPHISIAEREFVLRPLAELVPTEPLDASRPWKLIQDYLNELPPSHPPLTTLTPLSQHHPPLQPLSATRKTHVMAILNLTPDSFSDGGKHSPASFDDANNGDDQPAQLLSTVRAFLANGATLIDIGGQSTAPGAPQVSVDEELARVVPAIGLIRRHFGTDPVLSVDTYRSAVAEAAVRAGADMVNDVSGGLLDSEMLATVARLGCAVCLMHMRGDPGTMNQLNKYPPASEGGVSGAVARELASRVAAAEAAGVRRWRIVVDPGLGFAKRGAQNLDLLRGIPDLRDEPGLRGLPLLVGSSRKSFIGEVTGVPRPAERVFGTAATVAAAVQGGADIVRVHDVGEMSQVVMMADAIWRY